MRLHHRLSLVLALVLATLALPLVAGTVAAQACACGAVSPEHGGTSTVSHETALVRMGDDGFEDIYLSLTLDSDVRNQALLFPVPDPHTKVTAGPRDLFVQLAQITARPAHTASTGDGNGVGAAPAPPRVQVQSRQAIGKLDVVTLTANDPTALLRWLGSNGFTVKQSLAAGAANYIASGWSFMAVRLRPEAASATGMDGQLDPLHLRFKSESLIYPMRLSHWASEAQHVTVYALGDHRLELQSSDSGMELSWAGRLDEDARAALGKIATDGTTFLSRYDGTLQPLEINDDFRFVHATGTDVISVPTDAVSPSPDSPTAAALAARLGGDDSDSTAAIALAAVLGATVLLIIILRVRTPRQEPPRRSR